MIKNQATPIIVAIISAAISLILGVIFGAKIPMLLSAGVISVGYGPAIGIAMAGVFAIITIVAIGALLYDAYYHGPLSVHKYCTNNKADNLLMAVEVNATYYELNPKAYMQFCQQAVEKNPEFIKFVKPSLLQGKTAQCIGNGKYLTTYDVLARNALEKVLDVALQKDHGLYSDNDVKRLKQVAEEFIQQHNIEFSSQEIRDEVKSVMPGSFV